MSHLLTCMGVRLSCIRVLNCSFERWLPTRPPGYALKDRWKVLSASSAGTLVKSAVYQQRFSSWVGHNVHISVHFPPGPPFTTSSRHWYYSHIRSVSPLHKNWHALSWWSLTVKKAAVVSEAPGTYISQRGSFDTLPGLKRPSEDRVPRATGWMGNGPG